MKNFIPKAGIIAIFALILSVNGSTDKDVCSSLSYRVHRKRVEESARPELIIVEKEYHDNYNNPVLCHLDKSDNASSVPFEGVLSLKNNLAYDEHSRVLYAGVGDHYMNQVPIPSTKSKSAVHKRFARDIMTSPEELNNPTDEDIDTLLSGVDLGEEFTESEKKVAHRPRGEIRSMAYDYNTKVVFFSSADYIQVANATTGDLYGKVSHIWGHEALKDDRDDLQLLVHPNQGYLFLNPNAHELIRMNEDGEDRIHVRDYKKKTNFKIEAIILDLYKDKIYWLEQDESKKETYIRYSNLDGSGVNTLNFKNNTRRYAPTIAVDEKHVYFAQVKDSNNRNFVISRMDKTTGDLDKQFRISHANTKEVSYGLEEIIVLNPQQVKSDHPCRKNNGGCPGFCFGVPGKNGHLAKKCK